MPQLDLNGLARAVHLLSIVHWIGGLAVVTTIILPQAQRLQTAQLRLASFEDFERRFAAQARWSVALAGFSGFFMFGRTYGWDNIPEPSLWWIYLMIAIWTLFAFMLFILEPLFLHEAFRRIALHEPERAFSLAIKLHAVALAASILATAFGTLGAHGGIG